jgi:hypothetical protein
LGLKNLIKLPSWILIVFPKLLIIKLKLCDFILQHGDLMFIPLPAHLSSHLSNPFLQLANLFDFFLQLLNEHTLLFHQPLLLHLTIRVSSAILLQVLLFQPKFTDLFGEFVFVVEEALGLFV